MKIPFQLFLYFLYLYSDLYLHLDLNLLFKFRAPQSTAAYKSIGGGSPIVNYTQAQANLITKRLREKGLDAKCYFAMRYWNPYTEEVLEQIHADGVNSLVILPLYPQYSISTSGSSLKLLQELFIQQPKKWGPDKVIHLFDLFR